MCALLKSIMTSQISTPYSYGLHFIICSEIMYMTITCECEIAIIIIIHVILSRINNT